MKIELQCPKCVAMESILFYEDIPELSKCYKCKNARMEIIRIYEFDPKKREYITIKIQDKSIYESYSEKMQEEIDDLKNKIELIDKALNDDPNSANSELLKFQKHFMLGYLMCVEKRLEIFKKVENNGK